MTRRSESRLGREGRAGRRGDLGWGRQPVSHPSLAAAFSLLDGVSPSSGSRDLAGSRWPRRARPPAVLGVPASIASIHGLGAAAKEQGSDALREAAWPTARWHRAHPAGPAPSGTQKALARLRPSLPHASPPAQSRAMRAFPSCPPGAAMASSSARPAVLAVTALALFLLLCLGPGGTSGNKLKLMLQKREAPAPTKTEVAVDESKAKEFLGSLKRQKRQLWDRSRPDVQQWYQQFLYMGFDEAKFEDDVTYWLNRDRNGHDYYDYHRHYDEDAPIGPRSPHSFRHGASVNYDDY